MCSSLPLAALLRPLALSHLLCTLVCLARALPPLPRGSPSLVSSLAVYLSLPPALPPALFSSVRALSPSYSLRARSPPPVASSAQSLAAPAVFVNVGVMHTHIHFRFSA